MFDKWLGQKKESGNQPAELESVEELLRDLETVEIRGRKHKLSLRSKRGYDADKVAGEVFRLQRKEDPNVPGGAYARWENPNGITREDLGEVQEKYEKIERVLSYLREKGLVQEQKIDSNPNSSATEYVGQFAEKAKILDEKKVLLESILLAARDLGI